MKCRVWAKLLREISPLLIVFLAAFGILFKNSFMIMISIALFYSVIVLIILDKI